MEFMVKRIIPVVLLLVVGATSVFTCSGQGIDGRGPMSRACSPTPPVTLNRDHFPWPVFDAGNYPPSVPPSRTGRTYYVDRAGGSDANNGMTPQTAFLTIARAVRLVAAGDTVLIRKGLYREGINLNKLASGSPGKPITFGAFGDGEVILDGSTKVGPWSRITETIWRTPMEFTPVAVVVNGVPLRQVRHLSEVTRCSGNWYAGNGSITADMAAAVADDGDPNEADVVVPNDTRDQQHVYFYGQSHIVFKGLTVRGSGSNGIWGYGSHVTVESCRIAFNAKAAVAFQGVGDTDNSVLTSHIYHNVLINWPRGNNGFDTAGGGWPGTLVWYANLRPLARGNIIHMNGGEGLLSYGSVNRIATGSSLFEQNIIHDNWSVNLYFDNQPNGVARNNLIFNRPPDTANFIDGKVSLAKYSVCVMLADEFGSGDSETGFANLIGSRIYNNIIAGCRIGIRDYAEGSPTRANHGLKNTLIANNTIVLPSDRRPYARTDSDVAGLYFQDNGSRNAGTVIVNNVVYGSAGAPLVCMRSAGPLNGIEFINNMYWDASTNQVFASGPGCRKYDFASWRGLLKSDSSSTFQDPKLRNPDRLSSNDTAANDFGMSRLERGSPAIGTGVPQSQFHDDFAGVFRSAWNIGAY